MFKHFMIACNLAALTSLANAATPAEQTKPSRIDLKDCVTSTRSDPGTWTAELVGGTRVEITRSVDGTPNAIRIVTPDGAEASATSYQDLIAAEPVVDDKTAALDTNAVQGARSGQARRVLGNYFRTLVRSHCKRMRQEEAAGLKPSAAGAPDPGTDWLLWPELAESRAYWFAEARYQVEDTFYYGMDDWSNEIGDWIEQLREKQNELPACGAVRDDCRATCDRIGTYAGGVVCGGLAAVASALSAGIGVLVGVYCGGRVLLKMEECRFNCVVPAVPCSN